MVWHNQAIEEMIQENKLGEVEFEGHDCLVPEIIKDDEGVKAERNINNHILIINN